MLSLIGYSLCRQIYLEASLSYSSLWSREWGIQCPGHCRWSIRKWPGLILYIITRSKVSLLLSIGSWEHSFLIAYSYGMASVNLEFAMDLSCSISCSYWGLQQGLSICDGKFDICYHLEWLKKVCCLSDWGPDKSQSWFWAHHEPSSKESFLIGHWWLTGNESNLKCMGSPEISIPQVCTLSVFMEINLFLWKYWCGISSKVHYSHRINDRSQAPLLLYSADNAVKGFASRHMV